MCDPVKYLSVSELTQLTSNLMLTKCFEELRLGKLSIKENGAVVDVECSAHPYQQDFQAAWKKEKKNVNNFDPDSMFFNSFKIHMIMDIFFFFFRN